MRKRINCVMEIKKCRICFVQCEKGQNIFKNSSLEKGVSLFEAFVFVTGLIPRPSEPVISICLKCETNLLIAFKLKRQAIDTTQILENILLEAGTKTPGRRQSEENDCCRSERDSLFDIADFDIELVDNYQDQQTFEFGKKNKNLTLKSNEQLQQIQVKNSKYKRNPIHKCQVCEKRFQRKSNLIDHLRLHANVRPFKCDQCEKSFVQISNYKTHMHTHSQERPFKCKLCPKAFNQSSVLKIHIRSHTNERNYGCEECGKCFMSNADLTKHRRVHDPSKHFKCDVCGHGFAQKVNLLSHKKKVHPPDGIKKKKKKS